RCSWRALLDARRAVHQHVVEVHSLRRTGDAHAPTFPLPSPCAVTRSRLAGGVAISEHDHIAHIFRKTETPESGSRERRPRRISGRLHGGDAGLDALTDHQHIARVGEAHCTAAAWTEHHPLRLDRRLAPTIT